MKSSYLILLILLAGQMACRQVASSKTEPNPTVTVPKVSLGISGDSTDVQTNTKGGFVLMGGSTDVDAAIKWFLDLSSGGDIVIIRTTGGTGYNNYMYAELGKKVNSVETLLINSKELANSAYVVRRLREAEGLFIAGGDQATYVNYWKNTQTEDAINHLIANKKVPIGGTSAGCAILGEVIFDALNETITAEEALANPYHPNLTLQKTDFISVPFLQNTITDTHYSERKRQGRHFTFLARMAKDWAIRGQGIGVDEKTAVCIADNGIATVFGSGKAYFLMQNAENPEICEIGKPLTWNRNKTAIKSYAIQGTENGGGSFDVKDWSSPKEKGGQWEMFYAEAGIFKRE
ncbi:MAG: cyanophycinase [Runella slithyformis]|nr:MAG: cyanophycinase [Runella slithyformis]